MAQAFMAYPDLRHPFAEKPIHPEGSVTVLYQGRTITLAHVGQGDGLLIRPEDLPGINGFELKPEGACFEQLCIPISDDLRVQQDGTSWLDLLAFADLLEQPYVSDAQSRVWSFAEIPLKRQNMMVDAMAPDFEVTDRSGQVVHMADLKGKKALIVTWSSW